MTLSVMVVSAIVASVVVTAIRGPFVAAAPFLAFTTVLTALAVICDSLSFLKILIWIITCVAWVIAIGVLVALVTELNDLKHKFYMEIFGFVVEVVFISFIILSPQLQ
jgi:hypothetical protein